MRTALDLTLRRLGEGLQRAGEETVQMPLPRRLLELLRQLDEKEEAVGTKAADMTRAHHDYEAAYRRMSHDQRRACDSQPRPRISAMRPRIGSRTA